jgi:tetratricopeptide (TPR) repeat protein
MGSFDYAEEYFGRADKIIREMGSKTGLTSSFAILAELQAAQGNHKSALELARKSLSLAEETGSREQEALALRIMGKELSEEDPGKAISYLKRSISLARKQKMQLKVAKCLYELAKVLETTDKAKLAKKHSREAKKIFEKAGATGWLEKVKHLLGYGDGV